MVIPSRRGPRLAFALEALATQTLASERFEVIVVRDPRSRAAPRRTPRGLAVRLLTLPVECGPTAKRNVGWRSTQAGLVAFTDDDCRPAPEWLERLLSAASAAGDAIIQGRTEPDPDERHLIGALARTQRISTPSPWHEACNIAYPRRVLERLGGFDEAFEFGGEDTDLGLRATAAGLEHVYVDRAVVWHGVISRPLTVAVREATRWPSQPLVLRRHPQQRRAIHARWFIKRSHADLLLAAAGAIVLRRHPTLAALAALPYIELNTEVRGTTPRRLARQVLGLPVRAAVDAVEVAATARAAWRHRVLVL